MLTSLDLFSCVGCHALGFHRAGISTVAFCEIDTQRHLILADHFPNTPIFKDVTTFQGKPANIVVGGPPCQETSVAAAIHGKRTGASLWPDMLRIGLNVGAEWFVVEQPPGHAAWENEVGRSLAKAGYHVARIEFGACDIGAPYLRRRVFLLACTRMSRLALAWHQVPSQIESVKRAANARGDWDPDQLAVLRVDARSAGEMDGGPISRIRTSRIEALGDSNPPHMAEVIGRAIMAAA